MTYSEELILLKEADKYIQENNTEAAQKIFDIVFENDANHMKKASESFLYVAKKFNWIKIDCANN